METLKHITAAKMKELSDKSITNEIIKVLKKIESAAKRKKTSIYLIDTVFKVNTVEELRKKGFIVKCNDEVDKKNIEISW